MAKGNLFLGYGKGKVGSVVFFRQDGEQITRAYNGSPRNPRSNPQLYQRSVMATIQQAYKAGLAIFDHSFEGLPKGAPNQRRFYSRNLRILRETISADLDGKAVDEQLGRVVGPGAITPVGFVGMLVSEGSYPQQFFSLGLPDAEETQIPFYTLPAAASAQETRAQYAERLGLIAGDYYTFVGYHCNGLSPVYRVEDYRGLPGATQYEGRFFFVRLGVRADFVTATTAAQGATLADIFALDESNNVVDTAALGAVVVGASFTAEDIIPELLPGSDDVWCGVIRSRRDQDLRSTTTLELFTLNATNGIVSEYALAAWRQGTVALGNSSKILEGGNF